MEDEDVVDIVAEVGTRAEAETIADRLADAGIESSVFGENAVAASRKPSGRRWEVAVAGNDTSDAEDVLGISEGWRYVGEGDEHSLLAGRWEHLFPNQSRGIRVALVALIILVGFPVVLALAGFSVILLVDWLT